mgnify:CR=1 FL=1
MPGDLWTPGDGKGTAIIRDQVAKVVNTAPLDDTTETVGFFFSSRRRHTRSLCDWSSDVCSSDLLAEGATTVCSPALKKSGFLAYSDSPNMSTNSLERSEERRVGKECRSRWSPYH